MKLNKYVLALTCTFAAAAHAENNWYVLGSAGLTRAEVKQSDINSELETAGATIVSSDLDRTDTGYKFQVGYELMKNFAIEGGYVNLGKAEYKANLVGGDAKVEWKARGWNIDAVGIIPFTDSFSAFAKFGLIQAKVKATAEATGAGGSLSDSTSSTHLKSLFGFGAMYAINTNLGVRAEFESYNSLGDSLKTGEGDVYLLSAGVSYKF